MKYNYSYNFIRMAPRKVRLITNLVKDMSPNEALSQLKFSDKAASVPVYELIKSAIASLKDRNISEDKVKIVSLTCDGGPTLKRRVYKSRGRADEIKKRTTHIKLVIETPEPKKSKIKKNILKQKTSKVPAKIKSKK